MTASLALKSFELFFWSRWTCSNVFII